MYKKRCNKVFWQQGAGQILLPQYIQRNVQYIKWWIVYLFSDKYAWNKKQNDQLINYSYDYTLIRKLSNELRINRMVIFMEKCTKNKILICDLESLAYCKGLKTTIQRVMRELGVTGYVQKVYNPINPGSIAKTIAVALGPAEHIQDFITKINGKLPKNCGTSIKILGDLEHIGFLDLTSQKIQGPCIRQTIGKIKSTASGEGNVGEGEGVDMTKEVKEGILSDLKKKGALTIAGLAKYIPGISKDVGSAVSDMSIHDDPTYKMTARSLFPPTVIVTAFLYVDDPPNIARAYIERDTGIPFEKIALYTQGGVEIRKAELLKKEAETEVVYVDLRLTEAFFSTPTESTIQGKLKQYIKKEWFYHCLAAENMTVEKFKVGFAAGVSPKEIATALRKTLGTTEFDAYVIMKVVKDLFIHINLTEQSFANSMQYQKYTSVLQSLIGLLISPNRIIYHQGVLRFGRLFIKLFRSISRFRGFGKD
eukprot:TRINITY_DN810_c1_g2_i1.p1 TRINITY_DN810_c1_g2~~TRINITY_DN810_c1_g2_i1.p1  ORF type:complete len:479 (+),score=3.49 TRINITY_DN810_c1_g2_i1:224-1660(+)